MQNVSKRKLNEKLVKSRTEILKDLEKEVIFLVINWKFEQRKDDKQNFNDNNNNKVIEERPWDVLSVLSIPVLMQRQLMKVRIPIISQNIEFLLCIDFLVTKMFLLIHYTTFLRCSTHKRNKEPVFYRKEAVNRK